MSFASEVKKEILSHEEIKPCCKRAMVMGILHGVAELNFSQDGNKIIIKSTLLNVLKLVSPVLKEQYNIEVEIGYREKHGRMQKYYYMEIQEKFTDIVNDYLLMPFANLSSHHQYLTSSCCKGAYVAGIFVVNGSINDPRKEHYHLEITCKKDGVAKLLLKIFTKFAIDAKVIERRGNEVVYIKKSESIRDALSLMNATNGVFYFEDSRIYRDFVNMANRVANCDIANENKCARSCEKQLKAILYIRANGHFDKMPLRLQSIAKLREDYPDSSLDELAMYSDNVFGKKMSKSGISHCMNDLLKYRESITKKMD